MDVASPSHTKFGERAFSHAGPSAWNGLPSHIRDVSPSNSFRKILKPIILPLLLTFVNVCCCSYDFCTAPMAANVIGAL